MRKIEGRGSRRDGHPLPARLPTPPREPSWDAPVVGGREDGDTAATVRHLVAFGFDLVAADDVVELVFLQEGLRHVGPELAAHTTLADRAPVLGGKGLRLCASPRSSHTSRTHRAHLRLRVRPEQVTHGACRGHRDR